MNGYLVIFQQAHDLLQAANVGLVVSNEGLQVSGLVWRDLNISLQQ